MASKHNIEDRSTSALQRRQVGKVAWKMTINEILESERSGIAIFRAIRNRHPNDVEVQRLVAQGIEEVAERLISLNELLRYKGEEVKTE